jgi:4-nitrophenyl phosphatase
MRDNHPISALILDMDGVLWRENQPIGDLPRVFHRIKEKGMKVTLATNNATLSAERYLLKLQDFGVALDLDQIINSAQAAGYHLAKLHPSGGAVYLIGEDGLSTTLSKYGFEHGEENVLAVVAGLDRSFTYEKLFKATAFIRTGVKFIGTNSDNTLPTPNGLVPGAGAILAAIEAATDVKPKIVGKPSPGMYRLAMDRMHTSPDSTLVVGDRLETDIAGAQSIGCPCALVLSGVTKSEMANSWIPSPDWIVPDLTALLDEL